MDPASDSAVFATNYGIELVAAAYREDLVSASGGSDPASLTETEQNFVDRFDPQRHETILQQIVLRDDIYVPERVLEYNGPSFKNNNFTIESESLDNIVRTYDGALRPSSPSLTAPTSRAEKRARELHWCIDNGMISALYTVMSGMGEIQLSLDQFSGFIKRLAGQDVDTAGVPEIVDNKQLADAITQYIHWLRQLIEASETTSGPVVTDTNLGQLKDEDSPMVSETDHKAVALYFEDLKSVDVSSVEQALKVRESTHIKDFRKEVLGTISDIRSNDVCFEDINSRIDAANRALERVNLATKSRKMLFVLPFLAPHPITSAGATVGTGATIAYEFYAENMAYDWAFVSSH